MKRRVNIRVFDQEYTIKTEEDDKHIAELERFVNDEIRRIRSSTTSVSTLNVAVLTALNVSSYYLKERTEWEKRERRISRLAKMIEDEL